MKIKLKTTVFLIAALGALLSIAGSAQQADDPGVLLRAAIEKEEVDGDLQGAIDLYKEIIAKYGGNRAIAAKAQLHLGYCFEKLGFKEAQKAYQNVIDKYPEQTKEVKIAKEKLSIILKAQTVIEKGDKELKIRKVWAGSLVDILGAPSPDGRYLSFVSWLTGDLAIRELETGKSYRLTDKGPWIKSAEFALFSEWSPDSRQVVYNWYNKEEYYDLRVVDIDRREPRILYGNKDKDIYIQPFDWSPDGKNILVLLQKRYESSQIALLSVADSSLAVLRTEEKRSPQNALFSPDGRFIAFNSPTHKNLYNHDIFLLSIDGTKEITLVEHPAEDLFLGWAPDGNNILFASDRTGSLGLWMVEIEEGRQKRNPVLIKSDIEKGSMPMGITQNGLFYYGIPGVKFDVYLANRDPDSGEILDVPKKAIRLFEGTNMSPAWSPDGKYLAYVSMRGSLSMPNPMRSNLLCIRSLETGEEQEFKTQFSSFPINYPHWSPDGQYLLVQASGQSGQGIYRIDIPSGRVTPFIMKIGKEYLHSPLHSPQISTDKKTVFYVSVDEGWKLSHILARDIETGKERELYSAPLDKIALSPDGRQLALLIREPKERILKLMPSTGGEAREIYRFEQIGLQNISIAWTPDGKHIIHSKQEPALDAKYELWQVSVESGKSKKIGLAMHKFQSLSVHPDGRRVVFSSWGFKPSKSEVWVIENFLPKEK